MKGLLDFFNRADRSVGGRLVLALIWASFIGGFIFLPYQVTFLLDEEWWRRHEVMEDWVAGLGATIGAVLLVVALWVVYRFFRWIAYGSEQKD